MTITNVSLLRKNLFNSIDNVIEFDEPITINTKKGNAVLLSESEYNSLLETIYLTSQEQVVRKIKEGEEEEISKMEVYNPNEEW